MFIYNPDHFSCLQSLGKRLLDDIGDCETQTCVEVGAAFIYEVSMDKSHECSQELLCTHQGYFPHWNQKPVYLAGKFSHILVCISAYYMYDFLVCPALFIFS